MLLQQRLTLLRAAGGAAAAAQLRGSGGLDRQGVQAAAAQGGGQGPQAPLQLLPPGGGLAVVRGMRCGEEQVQQRQQLRDVLCSRGRRQAWLLAAQQRRNHCGCFAAQPAAGGCGGSGIHGRRVLCGALQLAQQAQLRLAAGATKQQAAQQQGQLGIAHLVGRHPYRLVRAAACGSSAGPSVGMMQHVWCGAAMQEACQGAGSTSQWPTRASAHPE